MERPLLIVGVIVALSLVLAIGLRFLTWRGKRLYAHVWHWWVVRRGTRRMLRRAEHVHAGISDDLIELRTGASPHLTTQQPETVVLPPRDLSAGLGLPDGASRQSGPARLDPKRARAEAEAVGLRVVNADEGPDTLAGWLLNAIGLSILIILTVWLAGGGYAVLTELLP